MREFDLLGFAAHLVAVEAHMHHAEHAGLEQAAEIVEAEAKESFGHYQDAAGPFAAWADLASSTKRDRVAKGFPEDEPLLRTGEMRDSIRHTVEGKEAVIGSDNEYFAYQELGTERIPPRSTLGGAAVRKGEHIAELLGAKVVVAICGNGFVSAGQDIK